MVLENNTVLITGGSSGIGLQLALVLSEKGNKVIICGRSKDKLDKAKLLMPEVEVFQCDLSRTDECERLGKWVREFHSTCNILINNAAIVHKIQFDDDENSIAKAEAEINTNLIAPIALSKLFIPIIKENPNPKIINITTGLVYAPKASYPFYNATKAALHSFTQVLRMQLTNSSIDVLEVLFPVVDTPWHKGDVPKMAISAEEAVNEMIHKIEKGNKEIKIGKVKLLYFISRISPLLGIKIINNGT